MTKDKYPSWLNEIAEGQRLEIKAGRIDPKRIGQIVCGFANADGGTVLIGVKEPFELVGIQDHEQLTDRIRNAIDKGLSPKLAVSITPIEVHDVQLLAIDVPQGGSRPYTWERGIFVRDGEQIRQADGADIARMLSQPRAFLWERQTAIGLDEHDVDESEVRKTWEATLKHRPSTATADLWPGLSEALQRLHLMENGLLRNSALVLFGKQPELRLPQTRVRAISYSDHTGDSFTDSKILEGHAFSLVKNITDFIVQHLPLSSAVPKNQIERVEGLPLPLVALREAVLNALQHRDYEAFDGGLSVAVRPGRVEIWNSGSLPSGMSVDDLKDSHHSRPHNPDIAHMFFLRGYVERLGSGSRRMVQECRLAGVPEPIWSQDSGGVTVTLRYGQQADDGLSQRLRDLINGLKSNDRITSKEAMAQLGVSERQTRSDLAELVELGYLNKKGQARGVYYVRTSKPLT